MKLYAFLPSTQGLAVIARERQGGAGTFVDRAQ